MKALKKSSENLRKVVESITDDRYVIYDQFHWQIPTHFICVCEDFESALGSYNFYRSCFPDLSLGLTDFKSFDNLYFSINNKHFQI